uniref:Uncharacterized protein n=1 Tax=Rhizophora mucronata TaxID=61149 RepID=A0A2P2PWS7_RHIMU
MVRFMSFSWGITPSTPCTGRLMLCWETFRGN